MERKTHSWMGAAAGAGRWLLGRSLYFLAVLAITIPVLFLRAGFITRSGALPGFDWDRYGRALRLYLSHLADGTFGPLYKLSQGQFVQTASGATIDDMIRRTLPDSLIIFGGAVVLAMAMGILVGLLVSRFAPGWIRPPAGYLNLIALSFPDVLLMVLVQFGLIKLGQVLGFEPLAPYGEWHGRLTLHTAIFPILILSFFPGAYIARVAAASFDGIFTAEYIRTARAKGLSGWRIIKDHAMRNAMIPILGGLPTASGLAISNLIVIEYLSNTGGMGRMLGFEFVENNAMPNLIVSVVICLAAVFVLIDGLVDIGLFWLDPKAREARRQELTIRRASRSAWWRTLPARVQRRFTALRAWSAGLGRSRPPAPAPATSPRRVPAQREPFPWGWYGRQIIAAYRWNLPLILGTVIVLGMVAVAILDPWIRPRDPYAIQALIYVDSRNFRAPPFAPGNGFLFGSDELGRDILSRVIHGTRFTLMFVALIVPLRILIALPIGLAAGWLKGGWEWWVSRIATIFGAVPMLILSATLVPTVFLPTRVTSFENPTAPAPAEASQVLLLHVAIMVLLGWPRLAESIRLMTRELSNRSFIEGAQAVGAPPWRVMRRHILPHLLPALAVIGAAETAWLMMLMTQLGVFNITLGGSVLLESVGATAIFPDWSHMLARPLRYLWARQWILIAPAVAFFIAILGFNLLAEGMRRALVTSAPLPTSASRRASVPAR